MTAAEIALLAQLIQAGIAAAPQIEATAVQVKGLITSLADKGAIPVATQDALHSHVDQVCAAALSGTTPPAWTVEADPA